MCGFAGVIAWDEKYRVTRGTLEKMSAAIAHRGPDGEGFHLTRENEPITPDAPQVALAFRRLAILDPDPRSNQPFHIGPLTLVFNGEIYNFRELRNELSKLRPDYQWRTTGDTEVLLMAYEVWQEKCVEKLNGMFAFAVWDEQKKKLFLARDRMGQKPLFFAAIDENGQPWEGVPATHADGVSLDIEDPADRRRIGRQLTGKRPRTIIFASEISALRNINWLDQTIRRSSLLEYLRWGYLFGVETIYRGLQNIPPATWLRTSRSEFGAASYFSPNTNHCATEPQKNAVANIRQLVDLAVKRQLVSDVPLGCFLSGGTDSSVVAAAMKRSVSPDQPVLTFSIGFNEPRYDEREYARAVAQHLGTQHHEFLVQPNAADDLLKLAATFGEPFADSSALPTYYLARETRKFVKVALSGDGSDELFGGYNRYRAMAIGKFLDRIPQPLRRVVVNVAASRTLRFLRNGHPKSQLALALRMASAFDLRSGERYASYMRLFPESLLQEIILDPVPAMPVAGGMIGVTYSTVYVPSRNFMFADAVQSALATDRKTYLPGDLLTKVDRCSMLHALEVRSPFMDHELVQFAAGLTSDQLLKGGPKRMLREAFAKDLPDFVFKRKKMGFAVPIGEWFRGELRAMLRDNLFASDSFARAHFNMKVVERLVEEHESQRVDHSQRLYALLMLELWWKWHRSF
jgi:asparagine synthase (glutamine-hydrolysing)